jgi:hypothetical protein
MYHIILYSMAKHYYSVVQGNLSVLTNGHASTQYFDKLLQP